jgi:hypothetical protein
MLHTSPLDQAGTGDAGGMNIYVVESAKRMAASGVSVDIFTRASDPKLPRIVDLADGVRVKHLHALPYEGSLHSNEISFSIWMKMADMNFYMAIIGAPGYWPRASQQKPQFLSCRHFIPLPA